MPYHEILSTHTTVRETCAAVYVLMEVWVIQVEPMGTMRPDTKWK